MEEINIENLSLQERILCVMNEIRIEKEGKNTFSNYDYFKPETINQKVNPLFLKYKIFPVFTTEFQIVKKNETESTENLTTITNFDVYEMAKLTLFDVLKKDEPQVYQMRLVDIEIKSANKMQSYGGARTYAKRYLYMEALNISDDKLDLDSDDMKGKGKQKPMSDDSKVKAIVEKITTKVAALRNAGAKDAEISTAIKSVYSNGGKPSANYSTVQTVEEAEAILAALGAM